jgi:glycosyl transferase family 2
VTAGPRFSVLLPTHSRADVLGFAIASVLAQTVTDYELLVVGDGCTDDTAGVVTRFSDPRLTWLDLPKAPLFGYAHRNMVLRGARGELVAFMTHDDVWLPDHLELLSAAFDDDAVEWAYSRPVWVTDEGTMVPFAVDLRDADQLRIFLEDRNTIPSGNIVYRRLCHERVGWYREDIHFGADWDMWKRIIASAGGANLAYQPLLTQLHFRASWKGPGIFGPQPLATWLVEARGAWWPPDLKVAVPAGMPPQAIFAELLTRDAPGWAARWRAAVPRLMDGLAWRDGVALAGTSARLAELKRRAAVQALAIPAPTVVQSSPRSRRRAWRLPAFVERARRRALLRLRPNPLFDRAWYRATNADLFGADPYRHWRESGAHERRNPNSGFSTEWYLVQYPDVAASRLNPLDHYYVYGQLEGRLAAAPEGGAAKQPLP